MREVEVTFGRLLSIWWAWTWRSVLVAMLLGGAIGFIAGLILALLGQPPQTGPIMAFNFLIGLLVGIWMLARVLKMSFPDFRIALIQEHPRQDN